MTDDIQDKSQDNDQTDEQDSWLTIAEAVQVTGKSDKTIRRWVSANKVAHKRESGRIFIKLSSLDLVSKSPGQDSDQSRQIKLDMDMTELTRLRAENKRLLDEVEYLRQANLAMLSKIPAIEAGQPQPYRASKGLINRIWEFLWRKGDEP